VGKNKKRQVLLRYRRFKLTGRTGRPRMVDLGEVRTDEKDGGEVNIVAVNESMGGRYHMWVPYDAFTRWDRCFKSPHSLSVFFGQN